MPFTPEEFLDVFRRYNDEVWPMQWILATVAVGAVILALRGSARNGRIVSGILAGLWLWMAVAYHFAYFATISRTAYVFGALFAGEALLLLLVGVKQNQLGFRVRASVTGVAGACLVMYALLIYPILSHALGHRYPASPTFGLPCATTIFTFGLLLWSDQKVPWRLIVIPAAWSRWILCRRLARNDRGLRTGARSSAWYGAGSRNESSPAAASPRRECLTANQAHEPRVTVARLTWAASAHPSHGRLQITD
jgi:hypothetical protein